MKPNMNPSILSKVLVVSVLVLLGAAFQRAGATGVTAPQDTVRTAGKTCTLVLTDVGPNKVQVVKILRTSLDIPLKEAYEMVGKLPAVILKDAPEKAAAALREELEKVGAKVDRR